ncbi:MAG: serine/threonine protein kinase, partial [Cyanobacteria bacterium]|nr:serine/threonine protein kinase [Cyanobacteriota bacterium]
LCVVKEAVVPSSADQASREKAMEQFSREAKFLMTLKHPRIAGILDNFVENGHHYLLLEYVDGKDLRKFVREKGPQKETFVLRWAIEIAEVLDYLHNLNPPIVHRDLTPDNLVLEADGGIAVIDFGAANEFLGAATGTLIGKQSYMSPEQFRGKACPQSDLYSLGATMHFLLTGKDPEALSESHPRDVNPKVSQELDSLVADLTSIELERRIASSKELIERCRSIVSESREMIRTEV